MAKIKDEVLALLLEIHEVLGDVPRLAWQRGRGDGLAHELNLFLRWRSVRSDHVRGGDRLVLAWVIHVKNVVCRHKPRNHQINSPLKVHTFTKAQLHEQAPEVVVVWVLSEFQATAVPEVGLQLIWNGAIVAMKEVT